MDGKVDDDADIRHTGWKRADAGDRDRQDIFARYRLLDSGYRRVEPFDMSDHQCHAGLPGRGDDLLALLDRRCDRLLDKDMNVPGDTGERDLMMQVRRRRDRDGINALRDHFIQGSEGTAAGQFSGPRTMSRQGIDDTDQ